MFRSEELRWRDEPQRRWREEERRDEQQWRGQLRWRDERWPAERWHNKHWRRYNDCRCRGERDYYDRHDDWHHDPRLDHDRRDQYQHQWQPHQHSNRRMGLPIFNDERQSHELMRNERPSSSHCADGSGQVDPLKLTAYISHAGSADALLALFAAHSTSLNHIHAANLWNKLGKQRIERPHEERLEQLV